MSETTQWLARSVVELLDLSAQGATGGEFAHLIGLRAAQLCPGTEVGVALTAWPGGEAVCEGSDRAVAELEALALRLGEAVPASGGTRTAPLRERFGGGENWPIGVDIACDRRYATVHSVDLAHDGRLHGVIDVFGSPDPGEPGWAVLGAFAQAAAAVLSQHRVVTEARRRTEQLSGALNSRVVIEQAKGLLAQQAGVSMDAAFNALRSHARDHRQRLSDLCDSLISGDVDLAAVAVQQYTMSAARRSSLRAAAVDQWRELQEQWSAQRERAATAVARSTELRVEVAQGKAARELDTIGRSIDRHFRELARTAKGNDRPRMLVGDGLGSGPASIADVLRLDPRVNMLGQAVGNADLLGYSMVEQPDVVILGAALLAGAGALLTAQLRAFCPDTRTLLVVDDAAGVPRIQSRRVDAVITAAEAATIAQHALKLCGARAKRPG